MSGSSKEEDPHDINFCSRRGLRVQNRHLGVDYCVELLLFVLVFCKTTLPPTTETERTLIKSLNSEDSFQSLYA